MRKNFNIVSIFVISGVIMPMIGIYSVSDFELSIYKLRRDSVDTLKYAYVFYIISIMIGIFLGMKSKLVLKSAKEFVTYESLLNNPLKIKIIKKVILYFLISSLLIAFFVSGKSVYIDDVNRGEIRTSLNGFGFLYKILIQYFVPAALAAIGMLYRIQILNGRKERFPFIYIILALMTVAMLGYKLAPIVAFLPFMFIISDILSSRSKLIIAASCMIIMAVIAFLTMNLSDLGGAFYYVIYRATSGTAWGLIAAWDLFPQGAPSGLLTLTPVFGNRITSLLLGIEEETIEYLQLNANAYITYLVHPNPDLALEGKTNLTITLMGTIVYMFGHNTFMLFSLLIGYIFGIVINNFYFFLKRKSIISPIIISIYITNIIFPILNSGSLIQIFAFYTLFYFIFTYFFVTILFMLSGGRKSFNQAA